MMIVQSREVSLGWDGTLRIRPRPFWLMGFPARYSMINKGGQVRAGQIRCSLIR